MRVALLTYSTKPRGGVVHTLALAESLAALGAEVDVWTLGRGGDTAFFRPVAGDVGVRAVPFEARDGEPVGDRIVRSIGVLAGAFGPRRGGYDIVHAQDCISANAALPCVRTVHHLDHFTTPELAACHERALVEPSHRVCVSAAVADEVRRGWGLTPVVIPNGVDAARFAAGASDAAGRARWRGRLGRYVLALGGIEPRKASIDLLEAFALLRSRGRPGLAGLRLVFGGGETLFDYRGYRAAFDARAAELGVVPEITGAVEEDDLPSLVAEASALAMVSAREGFGLAGMEALAAGVPVVARDLPVLREVYGDTVAFAADVPAIAAALERQLTAPVPPGPGRALAASYTWPRAAAAHLALYREILARLPPPMSSGPGLRLPGMAELLIDVITSLDGYGAGDGWPGWWGLEGPEYLAWLGEQPEADYTVLMGANTYRLMSSFAAEGEPGTGGLAGMRKVVFSSTLTGPLSWANTRLVPGDAVAAVRDLKKTAAEPMRTIGSLSLGRSLLEAGLVDRFRVVVFPVITGRTGRERIYDGYPDIALDLLSTRTFDARTQLLEYAPRVLAGGPDQ